MAGGQGWAVKKAENGFSHKVGAQEGTDWHLAFMFEFIVQDIIEDK